MANGYNSGIYNSDNSSINYNQNGGNFNLIGIGGGGGGAYDGGSVLYEPNSGGSSGGVGVGNLPKTYANSKVALQGNTYWDGATFISGGYVGGAGSNGGSIFTGGGGGAGGVGSSSDANNAGDGGIGIINNISGISKGYAGGGGGSTNSSSANTEGLGGYVVINTRNIYLGGNGIPYGTADNKPGGDGLIHTGSGGGGGGWSDAAELPGNGGSGIVIIRYSSTKTTENAIDSTNKLQIPAGSVITKTKGTFSPYSLYWDGDLNDNSDNSYLTSSLNNLTPPLSISFWKKQDKLVSEETLSITNKLSLSINSNLAVKFSVGSTTEIIENQADLDWHFWTITSDGSDNKLYRDGRVLLGSAITAPLTLSATDELMIGSNLLGQNDASPSYLEDLRIWKKSLTHQQIIDCMSIYPGYKNHANDLYLWYKFEDHPWNTSNIKDYSGDKRDGTIINNVSSGTFDDGYPGYSLDHENNLVAWYKFDDATNIGL